GLSTCGLGETHRNPDFPAPGIRAPHGAGVPKGFFGPLGRDAHRMEYEFNRRAGFTEKDDELPEFFYSEALPPTNLVARFHGADVHRMYERLPAPAMPA